MIENNPDPNIVVKSSVGVRRFCSDCEIFDKCDHKFEKIYECNQIAIDFAFHQLNYQKECWYCKGDFYDQPYFHYKLVEEAKKEILKQRKIKLDKKAK
jgi:hypothetical protein